MTIKDSNAHRKNKTVFTVWLTPEQLEIVNKAKVKGKVKTNPDLLMWLCDRFLVQP